MTDTFWNSLMPVSPRLYRLKVAGIETRILEAGPLEPDAAGAIPALLVHGASGHLESFALTLPQLARHRRTVAFDLPFHGYADGADHPFDVREHAGYVAALSSELGLGQVSLVGQSLGGAIAARLTVEGLVDVDRLVLIGSAGLPTGGEGARRANSMRAALQDRSFEVVKARLEFAMRSRGPVMDELIRCRYLAYQEGEWAPRVDAFTYHETPAGHEATTLSEKEWRSIDRPTLFVWGGDDAVVTVGAGAKLADLIAGSELRVFTGCGHNPQFELPDVVNPVIDDFLSGRKPVGDHGL